MLFMLHNFLVKLPDTLSTGLPTPSGPSTTAGNDVYSSCCMHLCNLIMAKRSLPCYPLYTYFSLVMVEACKVCSYIFC